MRPIEHLAQLQQLDSANDAIDRRLNEIRAELLDRSSIQEVEALLSEAQVVTAAAESDQRDLELEADQLRDKLKTEEGKLYGGAVKNPKELTDLTREVEQIKNQLGQRNDRMMAIMSRLDAARGEQRELSEKLAQLNEERAAREVEVKNEARGLMRQQIDLKKQIESARTGVSAAHLNQYDRLRSTKGGLAVAEIRQRICQGCRVGLTTSEEHRLRGDALITCSSCGRILNGGA